MADATQLAGWPHEVSPFHEGELRIQERLGFKERVDVMARRSVRDFMPDQHREFFEQLPFLVLGTVDNEGRPWASLVAGDKGFILSPDAHHLSVKASPLPGSPLSAHLVDGKDVGVLGIEPDTRRRNRMNGTLSHISDEGFQIDVVQSFGNCPRYIQTRTTDFLGSTTDASAIETQDGVSDAIAALIAKSDTFYIATAFQSDANALANGADVSHRGGKPGFVRVDGNRITFPDFNGNRIFNTLGNIEMNPKAGLMFIDYDTRDMAYLTGDARIIWEGEELESFEGAERLVDIDITSSVFARKSFPLRSSFMDYSPFLAKTGSWT